MYAIELAKEAANQSLYTNVNGHKIYLKFSTFREMTYVDIEFDDVRIIGGKRVVQNMKLLPSIYAKQIGGNLFFETTKDRYPTYDLFDGVNAVLLFDGEIIEQ